MHITVIGASRFGIATVKKLLEAGHEVILVDSDHEKLDELTDDLDCGMIHGDATLPSTLKDAFGDGSDALVALTNTDNVNILASLVGRSVGYDRVIPQIVRAELLTLVDALDLEDTITPHDSVAQSIVSALTHHSAVETQMTLHQDLRVSFYKVPDRLSGKTVQELDLPEGCRAVARVREDRERLVDAKTDLQKDDRLMLVFDVDQTQKIEEIFAAQT